MSAADRSIARLTLRAPRDAPAHDSSTGGYADAMMTAIGVAHRHARGVVVAVSPAETAEQIGNLRALEIRMNGAIGSENFDGRLSGLTVVASPYISGAHPLGSLAVVGPVRMDYERVIPLVSYTARALSRALGH